MTSRILRSVGSGGKLRKQIFGRYDGVRIGRPVDGMGGVHCFMAESSGRVLDQGDVVPELHTEAASRLDAGVGYHADQNDAADAVLFELKIEIGIREAARSPMLLDNDIARLG